MGYKIAVATSDGLNVDLHFGATEIFSIYEVERLDFAKTESRTVPDFKVEVSQGRKSGCDSGCGDRDGCHGEEKSATVEMLSDCRCIVCTKIGRNILKQFQRRAISTFDVTMPVKEALSKIVSYYNQIDERKLKFKNQEE